MKIYCLPVFLILFFATETLHAQTIYVRPAPGYGARHRKPPAKRYRSEKQNIPKFEPSVNLSFGYGFPNVDKEEFVHFSGLHMGNAMQTGPITGAINYRFSRNMGIGVMVTHGKVNVPYYDYYTGTKTLNGTLDNWAFMFDIVRYVPISNSRITPYIRTAIGVNSWKQDYTDVNGSKINYISTPSDFAYQAGIGANISLTKNAGLFLEAGYGKYILHGGLSFKF
ncbi:MAG: outer membrane beta-barrel protein [Ferruginibacter sp.]